MEKTKKRNIDLWERLRREKTKWSLPHEETGKKWEDTFNGLFDRYNESIGNSLQRLEEQPHSIQGREKEINTAVRVLERPSTPVGLLVGQAGVGKTALMEEIAKQINNDEIKLKMPRKYLLISLRVGMLSSQGENKVRSTFATIMQQLKSFEILAQHILKDDSIKIVLFIDEVHMIVTIFGSGTKIGGDVFKDTLARSPIRVMAATTKKEYDSTIVVDEPLSERFKAIEMQELPTDVVKGILINWWHSQEKQYDVPSDSMLKYILEVNKLYKPEKAEPRKSIDLMEDLISYQRLTGEEVDEAVVGKIFKDRYQISLGFNIEADDVWDNVREQIKGQEEALKELKRTLRGLVFKLDPVSNKPLTTALLTGPTGVGKTQTIKAIAEKIYPGEPDVLLNVNMPDYAKDDDEPTFRKYVGEFLSHKPNGIILLDEFEKASDALKNTMLSILDEGIISYDVKTREDLIDKKRVSLRNAMVFVTTNAGADVFDTDAKFNQSNTFSKDDPRREAVRKSEMAQLRVSLRKDLMDAGGFKPEMLNRFKHILPYRRLNESEFVEIAEIKIKEMFDKFYLYKGIKIHHQEKRYWYKGTVKEQYSYDLAMYLAFTKSSAAKTNAGGARNIANALDTDIYTAITDYLVENKTMENTEIFVSISEDAQIYNQKADKTKGGVVVREYRN